MTKTNAVSFRVEPDEKTALEQAAKDDSRTESSLLQKILKEWLRKHGYLPDVS